MDRPAISACIITYNEEQNIRECLESLKWVDEIIVVDSMSTDSTISICREYTDSVIQKTWEGHVKQKNFSINQARNDLVLCLDADERVTPELRKEIEKCLSEDSGEVDGYYCSRHSYYLGRWINHGGWYPDYKLRLFKKSRGKWGGKDPHDKVILEGTTKYLQSELHHFVYRNLSHQLQTVDNFSTITAQELNNEGEHFTVLKLLSRPTLKFLGTYFLKRGFLDGMPGLIISVVSSFYVFLRYAKLWEKQRQNSAPLTAKSSHE
ncbi:MAG: glycosyltransferase family 2 protein [Thermodesulfobacteriota bacterium]|nr:glycosyltransferase family 2 protein [Thermodesulfobacteriota bacterium]